MTVSIMNRLAGLVAGARKEDHVAAATGGSIESGEPVKVYEAASELEAEVIKTYLESNGIPVMLQGEALSKVYGLTVGKMAQVRVFVPAPLAPKALELLEEETTELHDEGDENAWEAQETPE